MIMKLSTQSNFTRPPLITSPVTLRSGGTSRRRWLRWTSSCNSYSFSASPCRCNKNNNTPDFIKNFLPALPLGSPVLFFVSVYWRTLHDWRAERRSVGWGKPPLNMKIIISVKPHRGWGWGSNMEILNTMGSCTGYPLVYGDTRHGTEGDQKWHINPPPGGNPFQRGHLIAGGNKLDPLFPGTVAVSRERRTFS